VQIGGLWKLLGAEDRVLGGLGDAELDHALGLDLDLFAGLGVAADAGGAVFQDELANAREGEGVLGVLVSQRGNVIQNFNGLFFGELRLLGDEGGDLGLGECFCHNSLMSSFVVVVNKSPKWSPDLMRVKIQWRCHASEKNAKNDVFLLLERRKFRCKA